MKTSRINLLFGFIFLLYSTHTIADKNKEPSYEKWVQDAAKLVTPNEIKLSLPDGSRGQKIPLKIAYTMARAESNVGEGWNLDIPYIELDINRIQKAGQEPFFKSNFKGPLAVTKNGNLVPLIQQDNESFTFHRIENEELVYYILQSNKNPRELWYFGTTSNSRLEGVKQTVRWYLDKIETVNHDKIAFEYHQSNPTNGIMEFPRLSTVRYKDLTSGGESLRVTFHYEVKRPVVPVSLKYGKKISSSHFLSKVVLSNSIDQKEVFTTEFKYKKGNSLISGQLYLAKVIRKDTDDSTPLVSFDICSDAFCLPNHEGAFAERGELNVTPQYLTQILSGKAKLAALNNDAVATIATYKNNKLYSKSGLPDSTIRRARNYNTANINYNYFFEKEVAADIDQRSLGSNGFTINTIWGFIDFDGNGRPDLYWVPQSNLNASSTIIKIAMANKNGKYSRNNILEADLGLKITNSKEIRFARLSGETNFSIVTLLKGSRKVKVVSWDHQSNTFNASAKPYTQVFNNPEDSAILELGSNLVRFADLNGDGFDDWVELPITSSKPMKYFPGYGNGKFAESIKCPLPSSVNPKEVEFLDVNNDGYPDLVDFSGNTITDATLSYLTNMQGNCFAGANGTTDAFNTMMLPIGGVGKELNSDRFLLDANGDGRKDVVVIKESGAFYVSFHGGRPGLSKVTKIESNLGLIHQFIYSPISDFYALKPINLANDNQISPKIAGGFYVLSETSQQEKGKPNTKRVRNYRYFGPTFHAENMLFAGFQVVEEEEMGDVTHHGKLRQQISLTGRGDNPYKMYLKRTKIYDINPADGSYKLLVQKDFLKHLLGKYDGTDPLNTSNYSYRVATYKERVRELSSDSNNHLDKIASKNYKFSDEIAQWKNSEDVSMIDARLTSECDGRICSEYRYANPFKWQDSNGLEFQNRALINEKTGFVQKDRTKMVRKKINIFSKTSGLVVKKILCADKECDLNQKANSATIYEYDFNSLHLVKEISPRGAIKAFELDTLRPYLVRKHIVKPSLDSEISFITEYSNFDLLQKPQKISNPNGTTTIKKFTSQGYLVAKRKVALGEEVPYSSFEMDFNPKTLTVYLKKIADSKVRIKGKKLNAFGNVLSEFKQGTLHSLEKNYEYSSRGFKTKEYVPNLLGDESEAKITHFDAIGRKIKVISPSGLVRDLSYHGDTIKSRDSDSISGKVTTKSFKKNQFNDIVEVVNELGAVYKFNRDVFGKVEHYTDPLGLERRFEKDLMGRIVKVHEKSPNQNNWRLIRSSSFGPDDKVEEIRLATGASITYIYDGLKRVIKRSSKLPGESEPSRVVDYDYDQIDPSLSILAGIDAKSQLTRLTNVKMTPGIEKEFIYNPRGVLAETKFTSGSQLGIGEYEFIERYEYNAFDDLAVVHYPDGKFAARYSYNDIGDIAKIEYRDTPENPWKLAAQFTDYTGFGIPQDVLYGNNITNKKVFDLSQAKLKEVFAVNADMKKLNGFQYEFDGFYNISSYKHTSSDPSNPETLYEFAYDNAHQLIEAKGPYGTLKYDYHASGRMESFEGSTFKFDSNFPLRPIKKRDSNGNVVKYEYDVSGNRIKKDGIYYDWNAEGKLARLCKNAPCQSQDSVVLYKYYYDENGKRIAKMGESEKNEGAIYFGKSFEIRKGDGEKWIRYVVGPKKKVIFSAISKAIAPSLGMHRLESDVRSLATVLFTGNSNGTYLGAYSGYYSSNGFNPLNKTLRFSLFGIILLIGVAGLTLLINILGKCFRSELKGYKLTSTQMERYYTLLKKPVVNEPFFNIKVIYYRSLSYVLSIAIAITGCPLTGMADTTGGNMQIRYFHYDIVGNTTMLTSAEGQVLRRNVFKPYGKIWQRDSSSSSSMDATGNITRLFHGSERDFESGLDYHNARMYDSEIGQFISRDPLYETKVKLGIQSQNELALYSFAKNNPLKYKDPSGYFCITTFVVVCGLAMGAYKAYHSERQNPGDHSALLRSFAKGFIIGAAAGALFWWAAPTAGVSFASVGGFAGSLGVGAYGAMFAAGGVASLGYNSLEQLTMTGKVDFNSAWKEAVGDAGVMVNMLSTVSSINTVYTLGSKGYSFFTGPSTFEWKGFGHFFTTYGGKAYDWIINTGGKLAFNGVIDFAGSELFGDPKQSSKYFSRSFANIKQTIAVPLDGQGFQGIKRRLYTSTQFRA